MSDEMKAKYVPSKYLLATIAQLKAEVDSKDEYTRKQLAAIFGPHPTHQNSNRGEAE